MAKDIPIFVKLMSFRFHENHRHNLQGCVNLFNEDTKVELEDFKSFPWISTYPIAKVLIPSIDTDSQEDTALKLCQKLKKYDQITARLKLHYKKQTNIKRTRKMRKKGMYPNQVVQFANHLKNHPDKYFSGETNWYFTGGTLEVIKHKIMGTMIVSAMGPQFDQLGIYHEETMGESADTNCQILTFPDSTPILEISSVQIAIGYFLLIRQKYSVTIIETHDKNFDLNECSKSIESDVPFVAAFLDKNTDFVYTLDAERMLKKWNNNGVEVTEVLAKSMIQVTKFKKDKDKITSHWGTICDIDDNIFIYADRHYIKFVDKILLDPYFTVSLEEYAYPCTEISFVKVSNFPNLIYVATTHDCFAISWKQKESKTVISFQVRWTHQLCSPPLFLKTCLASDNTELILLATMETGDSKILCNERGIKNEDENSSKKSKYDYKSYCMPSKLKNLNELYHMARLRSKCINPTVPIQKRIDLSTCGIAITKDISGTIKILTANSVGDIFEQELTKSEEGDITPWIDSMVLLEQHIASTKTDPTSNKATTPRFQNTGIENLKSLQKVYRCRQFMRYDDVEEDIPSKKRIKWKKSIQELKTYKDMLSQDILEVWELSDEETENVIDKSSSYMQKLPANEKVENWLQKMLPEEEKPNPEELSSSLDLFAEPEVVSQNVTVEDSPMMIRNTSTQKRQKKKVQNMGF